MDLRLANANGENVKLLIPRFSSSIRCIVRVPNLLLTVLWLILLLNSGETSAQTSSTTTTGSGNAAYKPFMPLKARERIPTPFYATAIDASADERTIAVAGRDGTQQGCVWMFTRPNNDTMTWTQQGPKITLADSSGYYFGSGVALSGDGSTLLVGQGSLGVTWVYQRSGASWVVATKFVSDSNIPYFSAGPVALTTDGTRAYVFGGWNAAISEYTMDPVTRMWASSANFSCSSVIRSDGSKFATTYYPYSLSYKGGFTLSADGNTIAIPVVDQARDGITVICVLTRNPMSHVWSTEGYGVVGTNPMSAYSLSMSLSANGSSLAVSAMPGNGGVKGSVWIFDRDSLTNQWVECSSSPLTVADDDPTTSFGLRTSLSSDGKHIAIISINYTSGMISGIHFFERMGKFDPWTPRGNIALPRGMDLSLPLTFSANATYVISGPSINAHLNGTAWIFARPDLVASTFFPAPALALVVVSPLACIYLVANLMLFVAWRRRVKQPSTKIRFGVDAGDMKKLQRYLATSNVEANLVPPYQRPYLYARVPLPFIGVVILLPAGVSLAAILGSAVQQSQSSCDFDPFQNLYTCTRDGFVCLTSESTTATFPAFLTGCGYLPLLIALPSSLALVPTVWLCIAFRWLGWGTRNKLGMFDGERLTLLHFAVLSKNIECVRLLLKHGADLQVEDGRKRTPVALAKSTRASQEMIDALTNDVETAIVPSLPAPPLPRPVSSPRRPASSSPNQPEFDVFFSHAWGRKPECANHHLVIAIADYLESKGLKVWINRDDQTNDIVQSLRAVDKTKVFHAMDKSKLFVAFLNQDYMDEVNGNTASDNCKLEFLHAARTKSTKGAVLPIVQESHLTDNRRWQGDVGMLLGKLPFADLSEISAVSDVSDSQSQIQTVEICIRSKLQSMVIVPPAPTQPSPASVQQQLPLAIATPLPAMSTAVVVAMESDDTDNTRPQSTNSRSTTARRIATPTNAREVRRWMEDNGLGGAYAEAVIQEGLTSFDKLRIVANLPVSDLKSLLGTDQYYVAAQFKTGLGTLLNDQGDGRV